MLKFLSRIIGLFLFSIAIIMAVTDATRTVAASELVTTPLGESWVSVSPTTLNQAQWLVQQYTLPVLWDPVMIWVLGLPGFMVFLALAMIFLVLGTKHQATDNALSV